MTFLSLISLRPCLSTSHHVILSHNSYSSVPINPCYLSQLCWAVVVVPCVNIMDVILIGKSKIKIINFCTIFSYSNIL